MKISRCRQAAYEHAGYKTAAKLRAIGRIRRVAEFFSGKNESVQLRAVNQVERELLEILPSEMSRYQKLRSEMLGLLDRARQLQ